MRQIALLSVLALMGCQHTIDVRTTCVPVVPYTPGQEKAMASALAALPVDSILVTIVSDYGRTRAAERACEAGK